MVLRPGVPSERLGHARWHEQGYPAGKAGEDIRLARGVFALCDVYDLLINERPYKLACTPSAALAEIEAVFGPLSPLLPDSLQTTREACQRCFGMLLLWPCC
ncbi:HD domain-containing phosphohydrolase [Deinococcus aerolatus]|uniref:HD domain-containing phosphohydrolase n=1 Tax=Deinococcus aerolatus TaxID=522487 RepID=UPI0035709F3C